MQTTAAATVTGQRSATKSSSSGSRRLDNPASAFVPDNALPPASMQSSTAHARMLGKFSGKSVGCQVSCGKCAAKYAACCPVPLPISSTKPERGKTSFSTARIGSLLRSHDGEDCFKSYSKDAVLKNMVRKQRYPRQRAGR